MAPTPRHAPLHPPAPHASPRHALFPQGTFGREPSAAKPEDDRYLRAAIQEYDNIAKLGQIMREGPIKVSGPPHRASLTKGLPSFFPQLWFPGATPEGDCAARNTRIGSIPPQKKELCPWCNPSSLPIHPGLSPEGGPGRLHALEKALCPADGA